MEKGNGENVMSCFSLKPLGKGEKQKRRKIILKRYGEMYALSDFLIMVFVMVSEAVT